MRLPGTQIMDVSVPFRPPPVPPQTAKTRCRFLRYANFFPLVDPPQSQNKPSGRLPCASNGIVPVDLGLFYPLHHRSGLHVR